MALDVCMGYSFHVCKLDGVIESICLNCATIVARGCSDKELPAEDEAHMRPQASKTAAEIWL